VNLTFTPKAYSLNATVFPASSGLEYLTLWLACRSDAAVGFDAQAPDESVVANAAIVPAGTGASISAFVTDAIVLILVVNGFFAP
jgi:hypothetical protein